MSTLKIGSTHGDRIILLDADWLFALIENNSKALSALSDVDKLSPTAFDVESIESILEDFERLLFVCNGKSRVELQRLISELGKRNYSYVYFNPM